MVESADSKNKCDDFLKKQTSAQVVGGCDVRLVESRGRRKSRPRFMPGFGQFLNFCDVYLPHLTWEQ